MILGNRIGTSADGLDAMGNVNDGIEIDGDRGFQAADIIIGQPGGTGNQGFRNLIAASGDDGIEINGNDVRVQIINDFIGLGVSGNPYSGGFLDPFGPPPSAPSWPTAMTASTATTARPCSSSTTASAAACPAASNGGNPPVVGPQAIGDRRHRHQRQRGRAHYPRQLRWLLEQLRSACALRGRRHRHLGLRPLQLHWRRLPRRTQRHRQRRRRRHLRLRRGRRWSGLPALRCTSTTTSSA